MPSSVRSTAPPSRLSNVACPYLAAVDQRKGEPVGEHRAQFLHQVEGKAGAAGPVAVQEAHGRIEPDALGRAAAIMGEQRVEEGEQGVDRVERRPARAAMETQCRVGDADQVVEDVEIDIGRLALVAAQRVDAFGRRGSRV